MISGRELLLATVEGNGTSFALCLEASAHFVLHGDDQDCLGQLHQELVDFARDAEVTQVNLRGAPGRGPYRRGRAGSKIEALLQLAIPVVQIINAGTLSAWARQHRHVIPATIRGLRAADVALHEHAIAAACIAGMQDSSGHGGKEAG
ncbi:DUF3010 family protein [Sphingosinicella sp. LY1275]|uniref:DUF3010 family protein n=1 Tax=Sphingosinicella sp. LY1275 TaxID=3095379 RepID=UPI002ADEDD47|nr:DUF3010 family protein [Sphingosinicella sp. LY1275]MEA1015151.1 DUF3010 family protein [Sphingosinicella sp. LY1275]